MIHVCLTELKYLSTRKLNKEVRTQIHQIKKIHAEKKNETLSRSLIPNPRESVLSAVSAFQSPYF